MTITVSLAVQLNGAAAHYTFEAPTAKEADAMARFLAGVATSAPLPALMNANEVQETAESVKTEKAIEAYKEQAKQEKPAAKKEQPAPATDTTPKSGQASSEPESANAAGQSYSYDQVKNLVTELVKQGKKEQAIALLQRFGMKVLAKDADADVYNQMGAMADDILAGTVDVTASVA